MDSAILSLLGAWLLGQPGSHHLGASGLTHGLMFLVFVLGLLRRDRAAIAAGMLAFMFYGGMLMTILPREPGVSWESHLGGAIAGVGAGCAGAAVSLASKGVWSMGWGT